MAMRSNFGKVIGSGALPMLGKKSKAKKGRKKGRSRGKKPKGMY